MKVKIFAMGENFTNCYIVYDEKTKNGFCVDVCDRIDDTYFAFIQNKHLKIHYLFLTHGHYDHTSDILKFKAHFPETKIIISKTDYENIKMNLSVFCTFNQFTTPDSLCEEGDEYPFADSNIKVMATPGHTSGSVCFIYDNMIFCGDTVFHRSIGRTDLATGSFFEIMKSVYRIANMGDYKLFPGHMDVTDIATEKRVNEYFRI